MIDIKKVLLYASLVTIIITICAFIFKGISQPIGFTYLLESFSTFENLPIPNFIESLTITSDWGVVNFLRDFLNIFTTSFGVIMNLCGYVINAFYYMYQFLQVLFIK